MFADLLEGTLRFLVIRAGLVPGAAGPRGPLKNLLNSPRVFVDSDKVLEVHLVRKGRHILNSRSVWTDNRRPEPFALWTERRGELHEHLPHLWFAVTTCLVRLAGLCAARGTDVGFKLGHEYL